MVLDLAVLFGSPDSLLAMQTDVPCRAAAMFSDSPPQALPRYAKVRGMFIKKGTSWSIPARAWHWQNEAGDTYTHTWNIGNWPIGAALWYYFDATQEGAATVSKSILFNSLRADSAAALAARSNPQPRIANALTLNVYPPTDPAPTHA